jgi:hypothetical protein
MKLEAATRLAATRPPLTLEQIAKLQARARELNKRILDALLAL